jgi:hypothetical protein
VIGDLVELLVRPWGAAYAPVANAGCGVDRIGGRLTSLPEPRTAATAGSDAATAALDVQPELVRLDYQQTTDLLRTLSDVRFKLLALVPTLSGTAIAILGHPRSAAELLGVGLLGLTATLGILLYELRNTQLYEYATRRAQHDEAALGLPSLRRDGGAGGVFSERPARTLRLFGLAPVDRDRGLVLVYSAALAGWTYLVAWGALRALEVSSARKIGALIGVAIGLLLLAELSRIHNSPDE